MRFIFFFLMSPILCAQERESVEKWCNKVKRSSVQLKWNLDPCAKLNWKVLGNSQQNIPLVYAEFGSQKAHNTTLIFAMVHGDEVTPLYLGIKAAEWMQANGPLLRDERVVIAPLVNPDGFFKAHRTRVNANGVDLNRNFPTRDWDSKALHLWKAKYKSDKRRYPGSFARSEPETLFQEELIRLIKPQKIISIHAPLNFLDYDGPNTLSLFKFPKQYVHECLKLRSQLKAVSGGFYPGSLGNYAGQERGIPTLTLELPTADPRHATRYWQKFKQGLSTVIYFKVSDYAWRANGHSGG